MSYKNPEGKLAVLLPGMGAVATTFIAGTMLVRRRLAVPVGSLTQMGTIRADDEAAAATPIKDYVPLASLGDLEFGGWDLFPDSAYEAAVHAEVLSEKHLALVEEELSAIRPMKAAFYPEWVRRLSGPNVKHARSKADMVDQLRADIRSFKRDKECDRAVAIWCGSTEIHREPTDVHRSIDSFEVGLRKSDAAISSSQLYAWACLQEGVPFVNGSPNIAVDFPAARELAHARAVAVGGKDFKTGQTLVKTVLAPGLRERHLGVRGWYSTNILGNRDGEVLDDPAAFRAKELSKLGVLESILDEEQSPQLYRDMVHKVRIDYYPPRGDAKEGWDCIDLFGWLGYPMTIKIDFQCRDSILAAPLVLDLVLLLDLAQRSGHVTGEDWLSFFFKAPMSHGRPVHDLFAQVRMLKNRLREIHGDSPLEIPSAPSRRDYELELEPMATPV